MTSKEETTWPVPLRNRDTGLGAAVREYAQNTEAPPQEDVAYARVLRRMAGRRRRAPVLVAGFAMGVAVTLVVALLVHQRGQSPSPARHMAAGQAGLPSAMPSHIAETSPPANPPSQTSPASPGNAASIRLASRPVVLPAGRVDLVEQATAVLSDDAAASARAQAGRTEISLARGSVELHVLPRAPGQEFAVSAGRYRFTVVGTAFTVSQTESRLELSVSAGSVAVWRGSERLATVGAGGHWSVSLGQGLPQRPRSARTQAESPSALALRDPAPRAASTQVSGLPSLPSAAVPAAPMAAAPSLAPPPAVSPRAPAHGPAQLAPATPVAAAVNRDCGQLVASHDTQGALSCYQKQAATGGLVGEAAQYEVARLWRDSFGNPARALAAFEEQRARFPHGVLRIEADLSIIELLPRLNRHSQALAESEQYLKSYPNAERRGEIHLLRGNIFREVSRDLDHAEREYALGAEASGRTGDDSHFFRAVCLEALGRVEAARKAYESYLVRPGAQHAQDAKRRLERLGQ